MRLSKAVKLGLMVGETGNLYDHEGYMFVTNGRWEHISGDEMEEALKLLDICDVSGCIVD